MQLLTFKFPLQLLLLPLQLLMMLVLQEYEIRQLELCHAVFSSIVMRSRLDGGTENHCLPRHETAFVSFLALTFIERQRHK